MVYARVVSFMSLVLLLLTLVELFDYGSGCTFFA